MTATGMIQGTPDYLSPELIGRGNQATLSADLYSLGCVAFWLLTGRRVFSGSDLMEVLMRHRNEAPHAPSEFAPRPIPPELDAVVLSCLAKDPCQRPRSAFHLRELLADVPLETTWSRKRAAAWWQSLVVEDSPSFSESETIDPSGAVDY